jgi:hypothetical protein
MACECISGCPFYNGKMQNKPAMASIYKKQYCEDDFMSCARYLIFAKLGKQAVPYDLFPTMVDRALKILSETIP